ncbi:MAG: DUF3106 domain-containing protein [Rhodocyclaceae bacterium]|nr:DUF3106 domain-containing protein [Rhodocyclaceae bacterium]
MAGHARRLLILLATISSWTAFGQSDPPFWRDLSPTMQGVLGPIEGEWAGMDAERRRKWIAIGQHYDTLTPAEQQNLLSRMRAWVRLSPRERERARDRYRQWLAIPAEQRQALRERWEEYQNLPPEERARIRADDHR